MGSPNVPRQEPLMQDFSRWAPWLLPKYRRQGTEAILWFQKNKVRKPLILTGRTEGKIHYIPLFRLAASVLWCWSWEKEGRAVEVVPGFRLYIGSFVFHVHSYLDQFIQPGWAECVLFCLALYFMCWYCFNLFVSPSFCISLTSWVISLTGFGAGITNLKMSLLEL